MIRLRKWSVWSAFAAASVGVATWTVVAQNTSKATATATANADAAADEKPDPQKEEILKRAKLYMVAYNKHDAKTIASLFTENAELVERSGETVRGRKAIQEEFTEFFKDNPKAQVSMAVDALRRVAPTVAVEEGRMTTYLDGKTAAFESTYQVVHVRDKSGWLMAHARTLRNEAASPHQRLKELEWMVGEWIDEQEDSVTETTCEWSADGNFLLRKFTLKIEGERVMNGVQRIGWDPLTKQFKSWVFDSEGGYAEGLWSRIGDKWVIKARGVRQDGTVVTATNQFTPIDKDRIQWISVHRITGDEHLPDVAVTIVRKPPKASR